MNENNSFLSGYGKKDGYEDSAAPLSAAPSVSVQDANIPSMKYEEKSHFIKPKKKNGSRSTLPPKNGKIIVPIIIAAVVVAAVVIGLILLLGGGVEAKDFTDWALVDVQLWASENDIRLQVDEQYSDVFDENKIIAQSVAQGSKIKKGEFIALTVSLGHDLTVTLPLPDLMSMTKDEIETWADENYMTKVRFTSEYNGEVELGYVIRYEINDNTVVDEVRRDTPVYIVVSKGAEDETAIQITVPDFKTMALSEIYAFGDENGIELTVEEQYDDYVPAGSIISQSIKADEKVSKGDEIVLVVSKGKEIIIPDFSGYSKDKAMAKATELGIPITIKERYSSASAGVFLWQSLDADTVLEDGDLLELCYSVGNKIVVSSFVGQTRDAIESWAKELNTLDARITISTTYTQNNAASGTIVHQDIANTVIGRGTTIHITISQGKAVFMPDFGSSLGAGYDVAITRKEASEMCEALGIVPIFIQEAAPNRLPGVIWYQSVAAGAEVSEGSTVTLKFTPTDATVVVPSFVGMTEDEIVAGGYHQALHITFTQSLEPIDGYEGKVYEQTLSVGTTVAQGSTITLSVSPAAVPEPTPSPTPESSADPSPTPSA